MRPSTPTAAPSLLRPEERSALLLGSGPWSLLLRGGDLDDIRFEGRPILRSIRFVVRDRDWRTIPSAVSRVDVDPAGRAVVVSGRAAEGDIAVAWTLTVSLAEASLRVELDAIAETDFLRNRLGLIVLHPPACAGTAVEVSHPDGSTTSSAFPQAIAPHQPARDIAALAWHAEGTAVGLRFGGDVFEMEDQRNWTDASFKTYSTPLSLPFPVEVSRGERVRQSIELACTAPIPVLRIRIGSDPIGRMPTVGTSATTAPDEEYCEPVPSPFGPLLVEVDLRESAWRSALARASRESGSRGLDLRIVTDDPGELRRVLDELAPTIRIERVGVFDPRSHLSEPALLDALEAELRRRGSAAPIVAGVRSHFTELNRGHERLAEWPGALTFSTTPFMHDRAGNQLVESIQMQRIVLRDAVRIARGRELHVGPITLGARFNAVATSDAPSSSGRDTRAGYGPQHVPGASDPRQSAESLGAWTIASIAALASGGAASLSYFEESGPRGIRTAAGPSPAGIALGWAAELAGAPLLHASAEGVHALVVDTGAGPVVLLANLADHPVDVELEPAAGAFTVDSSLPSSPREPARPGHPIRIEFGEAVRLRSWR